MTLHSFEQNRTRYLIGCMHCGTRFDAIAASWCACVTRTPTLLCPSCERCFCEADHRFKLEFWAGAPTDFGRRNPVPRNLEIEPAAMVRPLVLVADDVAAMRLLAMAMLRRLGLGVVLARDGEEAWKLALELRPELVLTDALMPRLDGRDLCRRIKTSPVLKETPVIVMSAVYMGQRHQKEALTTFMADGYLIKPFNLAALTEMLEKFLPVEAVALQSEAVAVL